jgi:hypothetical protein
VEIPEELNHPSRNGTLPFVAIESSFGGILLNGIFILDFEKSENGRKR